MATEFESQFDLNEGDEKQNDVGGELAESQQETLKEIFELFDFHKDGHIATDDLGTIIRGLGFNLTEAQINGFINSYDETGSGFMDFPTFYRLMRDNRPMRGPAQEEDVLKHFEVFDIYKDGHIAALDLVQLLRTKGEPLTQDDVDNLLCEIEIDGDNKIKIEDLVRHMCETSMPEPEA